jgi:hypothetical protein
VSVRRVFPGQVRGNRARLFTVNLPDDLSEKEVGRVIAVLREQAALEYAEITAAKKPLGE